MALSPDEMARLISEQRAKDLNTQLEDRDGGTPSLMVQRYRKNLEASGKFDPRTDSEITTWLGDKLRAKQADVGAEGLQAMQVEEGDQQFRDDYLDLDLKAQDSGFWGEMGGGLNTASRGLVGTMSGAYGMTGLPGHEGAWEWGVDVASGAPRASVRSYKDIYRANGISLEALSEYAGSSIGQAIPSLVEAIGAFFIGSATGGAGAAAVYGGKQAVQQGVKSQMRSALRKSMRNKIAKKMPEYGAKHAAVLQGRKKVGDIMDIEDYAAQLWKVRGGTAASTLNSLALNSGEVYNGLREDGFSHEESQLSALAYGSISALPDSLLPAWVGRSFLKRAGLMNASTKAKNGALHWLGRQAKALGKTKTGKTGIVGFGVALEGTTEAFQEFVAYAAPAWKKGEDVVWNDQVLSRLINASIVGMVGGGLGAGLTLLGGTEQAAPTLEGGRVDHFGQPMKDNTPFIEKGAKGLDSSGVSPDVLKYQQGQIVSWVGADGKPQLGRFLRVKEGKVLIEPVVDIESKDGKVIPRTTSTAISIDSTQVQGLPTAADLAEFAQRGKEQAIEEADADADAEFEVDTVPPDDTEREVWETEEYSRYSSEVGRQVTIRKQRASAYDDNGDKIITEVTFSDENDLNEMRLDSITIRGDREMPLGGRTQGISDAVIEDAHLLEVLNDTGRANDAILSELNLTRDRWINDTKIAPSKSISKKEAIKRYGGRRLTGSKDIQKMPELQRRRIEQAESFLDHLESNKGVFTNEKGNYIRGQNLLNVLSKLQLDALVEGKPSTLTVQKVRKGALGYLNDARLKLGEAEAGGGGPGGGSEDRTRPVAPPDFGVKRLKGLLKGAERELDRRVEKLKTKKKGGKRYNRYKRNQVDPQRKKVKRLRGNLRRAERDEKNQASQPKESESPETSKGNTIPVQDSGEFVDIGGVKVPVIASPEEKKVVRNKVRKAKAKKRKKAPPSPKRMADRKLVGTKAEVNKKLAIYTNEEWKAMDQEEQDGATKWHNKKKRNAFYADKKKGEGGTKRVVSSKGEVQDVQKRTADEILEVKSLEDYSKIVDKLHDDLDLSQSLLDFSKVVEAIEKAFPDQEAGGLWVYEVVDDILARYAKTHANSPSTKAHLRLLEIQSNFAKTPVSIPIESTKEGQPASRQWVMYWTKAHKGTEKGKKQQVGISNSVSSTTPIGAASKIIQTLETKTKNKIFNLDSPGDLGLLVMAGAKSADASKRMYWKHRALAPEIRNKGFGVHDLGEGKGTQPIAFIVVRDSKGNLKVLSHSGRRIQIVDGDGRIITDPLSIEVPSEESMIQVYSKKGAGDPEWAAIQSGQWGTEIEVAGLSQDEIIAKLKKGSNGGLGSTMNLGGKTGNRRVTRSAIVLESPTGEIHVAGLADFTTKAEVVKLDGTKSRGLAVQGFQINRNGERSITSNYTKANVPALLSDVINEGYKPVHVIRLGKFMNIFGEKGAENRSVDSLVGYIQQMNFKDEVKYQEWLDNMTVTTGGTRKSYSGGKKVDYTKYPKLLSRLMAGRLTEAQLNGLLSLVGGVEQDGSDANYTFSNAKELSEIKPIKEAGATEVLEAINEFFVSMYDNKLEWQDVYDSMLEVREISGAVHSEFLQDVIDGKDDVSTEALVDGPKARNTDTAHSPLQRINDGFSPRAEAELNSRFVQVVTALNKAGVNVDLFKKEADNSIYPFLKQENSGRYFEGDKIIQAVVEDLMNPGTGLLGIYHEATHFGFGRLNDTMQQQLYDAIHAVNAEFGAKHLENRSRRIKENNRGDLSFEQKESYLRDPEETVVEAVARRLEGTPIEKGFIRSLIRKIKEIYYRIQFAIARAAGVDEMKAAELGMEYLEIKMRQFIGDDNSSIPPFLQFLKGPEFTPGEKAGMFHTVTDPHDIPDFADPARRVLKNREVSPNSPAAIKVNSDNSIDLSSRRYTGQVPKGTNNVLWGDFGDREMTVQSIIEYTSDDTLTALFKDSHKAGFMDPVIQIMDNSIMQRYGKVALYRAGQIFISRDFAYTDRVEGDTETTMSLDIQKKALAEILGHEMTHHISESVFLEAERTDGKSGLLTSKAKQAKKDWTELLDAARKFVERKAVDGAGGRWQIYGLTSVREFISEARNNPMFQRFLMQMPLPEKLAKRFNIKGRVWDGLNLAMGRVTQPNVNAHKATALLFKRTLEVGASIKANPTPASPLALLNDPNVSPEERLIVSKNIMAMHAILEGVPDVKTKRVISEANEISMDEEVEIKGQMVKAHYIETGVEPQEYNGVVLRPETQYLLAYPRSAANPTPPLSKSWHPYQVLLGETNPPANKMFWKIYRTPTFKKYFGDWQIGYRGVKGEEELPQGSVQFSRDPETNEPQVLWHGRAAPYGSDGVFEQQAWRMQSVGRLTDNMGRRMELTGKDSSYSPTGDLVPFDAKEGMSPHDAPLFSRMRDVSEGQGGSDTDWGAFASDTPEGHLPWALDRAGITRLHEHIWGINNTINYFKDWATATTTSPLGKDYDYFNLQSGGSDSMTSQRNGFPIHLTSVIYSAGDKPSSIYPLPSSMLSPVASSQYGIPQNIADKAVGRLYYIPGTVSIPLGQKVDAVHAMGIDEASKVFEGFSDHGVASYTTKGDSEFGYIAIENSKKEITYRKLTKSIYDILVKGVNSSSPIQGSAYSAIENLHYTNEKVATDTEGADSVNSMGYAAYKLMPFIDMNAITDALAEGTKEANHQEVNAHAGLMASRIEENKRTSGLIESMHDAFLNKSYAKPVSDLVTLQAADGSQRTTANLTWEDVSAGVGVPWESIVKANADVLLKVADKDGIKLNIDEIKGGDPVMAHYGTIMDPNITIPIDSDAALWQEGRSIPIFSGVFNPLMMNEKSLGGKQYNPGLWTYVLQHMADANVPYFDSQTDLRETTTGPMADAYFENLFNIANMWNLSGARESWGRSEITNTEGLIDSKTINIHESSDPFIYLRVPLRGLAAVRSENTTFEKKGNSNVLTISMAGLKDLGYGKEAELSEEQQSDDVFDYDIGNQITADPNFKGGEDSYALPSGASPLKWLAYYKDELSREGAGELPADLRSDHRLYGNNIIERGVRQSRAESKVISLMFKTGHSKGDIAAMTALMKFQETMLGLESQYDRTTSYGGGQFRFQNQGYITDSFTPPFLVSGIARQPDGTGDPSLAISPIEMDAFRYNLYQYSQLAQMSAEKFLRMASLKNYILTGQNQDNPTGDPEFGQRQIHERFMDQARDIDRHTTVVEDKSSSPASVGDVIVVDDSLFEIEILPEMEAKHQVFGSLVYNMSRVMNPPKTLIEVGDQFAVATPIGYSTPKEGRASNTFNWSAPVQWLGGDIKSDEIETHGSFVRSHPGMGQHSPDSGQGSMQPLNFSIYTGDTKIKDKMGSLEDEQRTVEQMAASAALINNIPPSFIRRAWIDSGLTYEPDHNVGKVRISAHGGEVGLIQLFNGEDGSYIMQQDENGVAEMVEPIGLYISETEWSALTDKQKTHIAKVVIEKNAEGSTMTASDLGISGKDERTIAIQTNILADGGPDIWSKSGKEVARLALRKLQMNNAQSVVEHMDDAETVSELLDSTEFSTGLEVSVEDTKSITEEEANLELREAFEEGVDLIANEIEDAMLYSTTTGDEFYFRPALATNQEGLVKLDLPSMDTILPPGDSMLDTSYESKSASAKLVANTTEEMAFNALLEATDYDSIEEWKASRTKPFPVRDKGGNNATISGMPAHEIKIEGKWHKVADLKKALSSQTEDFGTAVIPGTEEDLRIARLMEANVNAIRRDEAILSFIDTDWFKMLKEEGDVREARKEWEERGYASKFFQRWITKDGTATPMFAEQNEQGDWIPVSFNHVGKLGRRQNWRLEPGADEEMGVGEDYGVSNSEYNQGEAKALYTSDYALFSSSSSRDLTLASNLTQDEVLDFDDRESWRKFFDWMLDEKFDSEQGLFFQDHHDEYPVPEPWSEADQKRSDREGLNTPEWKKVGSDIWHEEFQHRHGYDRAGGFWAVDLDADIISEWENTMPSERLPLASLFSGVESTGGGTDGFTTEGQTGETLVKVKKHFKDEATRDRYLRVGFPEFKNLPTDLSAFLVEGSSKMEESIRDGSTLKEAIIEQLDAYSEKMSIGKDGLLDDITKGVTRGGWTRIERFDAWIAKFYKGFTVVESPSDIEHGKNLATFVDNASSLKLVADPEYNDTQDADASLNPYPPARILGTFGDNADILSLRVGDKAAEFVDAVAGDLKRSELDEEETSTMRYWGTIREATGKFPEAPEMERSHWDALKAALGDAIGSIPVPISRINRIKRTNLKKLKGTGEVAEDTVHSLRHNESLFSKEELEAFLELQTQLENGSWDSKSELEKRSDYDLVTELLDRKELFSATPEVRLKTIHKRGQQDTSPERAREKADRFMSLLYSEQGDFRDVPPGQPMQRKAMEELDNYPPSLRTFIQKRIGRQLGVPYERDIGNLEEHRDNVAAQLQNIPTNLKTSREVLSWVAENGVTERMRGDTRWLLNNMDESSLDVEIQWGATPTFKSKTGITGMPKGEEQGAGETAAAFYTSGEDRIVLNDSNPIVYLAIHEILHGATVRKIFGLEELLGYERAGVEGKLKQKGEESDFRGNVVGDYFKDSPWGLGLETSFEEGEASVAEGMWQTRRMNQVAALDSFRKRGLNSADEVFASPEYKRDGDSILIPTKGWAIRKSHSEHGLYFRDDMLDETGSGVASFTRDDIKQLFDNEQQTRAALRLHTLYHIAKQEGLNDEMTPIYDTDESWMHGMPDKYEITERHYGLEQFGEFVTELWTNRVLQNDLKDLAERMPEYARQRAGDFFSTAKEGIAEFVREILNTVRDFLGLPSSESTEWNALAQAMQDVAILVKSKRLVEGKYASAIERRRIEAGMGARGMTKEPPSMKKRRHARVGQGRGGYGGLGSSVSLGDPLARSRRSARNRSRLYDPISNGRETREDVSRSLVFAMRSRDDFFGDSFIDEEANQPINDILISIDKRGMATLVDVDKETLYQRHISQLELTDRGLDQLDEAMKSNLVSAGTEVSSKATPVDTADGGLELLPNDARDPRNLSGGSSQSIERWVPTGGFYDKLNWENKCTDLEETSQVKAVSLDQAAGYIEQTTNPKGVQRDMEILEDLKDNISDGKWIGEGDLWPASVPQWGDDTDTSSFGVVVIDGDGKIVLREAANHFDGYHWTFSKGRIDEVHEGNLSSDAKPRAAAIREVLEETGIRLKNSDIVGHLPKGYKSGSSTTYFYVAQIPQSSPVVHRNEVWEAKEVLRKQYSVEYHGLPKATAEAVGGTIASYITDGLVPSVSLTAKEGEVEMYRVENFEELSNDPSMDNQYRSLPPSEQEPVLLENKQIILDLLSHAMADFIVNNRDGHAGNFGIVNGRVVSIDKGQAFKYNEVNASKFSQDYESYLGASQEAVRDEGLVHFMEHQFDWQAANPRLVYPLIRDAIRKSGLTAQEIAEHLAPLAERAESLSAYIVSPKAKNVVGSYASANNWSDTETTLFTDEVSDRASALTYEIPLLIKEFTGQDAKLPVTGGFHISPASMESNFDTDKRVSPESLLEKRTGITDPTDAYSKKWSKARDHHRMPPKRQMQNMLQTGTRSMRKNMNPELDYDAIADARVKDNADGGQIIMPHAPNHEGFGMKSVFSDFNTEGDRGFYLRERIAEGDDTELATDPIHERTNAFDSTQAAANRILLDSLALAYRSAKDKGYTGSLQEFVAKYFKVNPEVNLKSIAQRDMSIADSRITDFDGNPAMTDRTLRFAASLHSNTVSNLTKSKLKTEETLDNIMDDIEDAAEEVTSLTSKWKDANAHEKIAQTNIKRLIKEHVRGMDGQVDLSMSQGKLLGSIQEIERVLAGDDIASIYKDALYEIYDGNIKVFDYLQAMAELGIDYAKSSEDAIISEIFDSDNPMLKSLGNNKPLLATLVAFSKDKSLQMALLEARTTKIEGESVDVGNEIKRVQRMSKDQLKDLLDEVRGIRKSVSKVYKVRDAYAAARLKYKQKKDMADRLFGEVKTIEAALSSVRKSETELQTRLGFGYNFRAVPGERYLVMQKVEGNWVSREEIYSVEGSAENRSKIEQAKYWNRIYLEEQQAQGKGDEPFNRVIDDMLMELSKAVVHRDYQTINLNVLDRNLSTLEQRLRSLGQAGVQITRMIAEFRRVNTNARNDIVTYAGKWEGAFGEAIKASGMEQEIFQDLVYNTGIYWIENMPEFADDPVALHSAVFREIEKLYKTLGRTPKPELKKALSKLWTATELVSDWENSIADENNVLVEDPSVQWSNPLTGRRENILRRRIKYGRSTIPRRMRGEVIAVITSEMDKLGWRKAKGQEIHPLFAEIARLGQTTLAPDQAYDQMMQVVSTMLNDTVVNTFLDPLLTKPGDPIFTAPQDRGSNSKNPIPQDMVAAAWLNSGKNFPAFVRDLFLEFNAPPEDLPTFAASIVKRLRGIFHMTHQVASKVDTNPLNPNGMHPHRMMDARTNTIFPREWLEYDTFTKVDTGIHIAKLSSVAAFGRDSTILQGMLEAAKSEARRNAQAFGVVAQDPAYLALTTERARKKYIERKLGKNQAQAAYATLRTIEEVDSLAKAIRDLFTAPGGGFKDFRLFEEAFGFNADLVLRTPKSGLWQALSGMDYTQRLGYGTLAGKASGTFIWNSIKNFFGSLFNEGLGIPLMQASESARVINQIRSTPGQQDLTFRELMANHGVKGTGEGAIKLMRRTKDLLDKSVGLKGGKAGSSGFAPFTPLSPFAWLNNVFGSAVAEGSINIWRTLVTRGLQYMDNNPSALSDPNFRFTLKKLGIMGSILGGNERALEYHQDTWAEHTGQSFLDFVKQAYARREAKQEIFSKEDYLKMYQIAMDDINLEGGIGSTPVAFRTNSILRNSTHLLRWATGKVNAVNWGMKTQEGRYTVNSVLKGFAGIGAVGMPIGIAATMLMDEYDEEILGKKSNLRGVNRKNLLPGYAMYSMLTNKDGEGLAILERLARSGNVYGLGMEAAYGMAAWTDPMQGQRSLGIDRILVYSQVANARDAFVNMMHSDWHMGYEDTKRIIDVMFGQAPAHLSQTVNNLLYPVNENERRRTKRVDAYNYIRSAGRAAGLDLKRSGMRTNPTPLTARIRSMQLAAYGDDPEEFLRLFDEAQQAAVDMGKEDPISDIVRSWKAREPLDLFQAKLSEEEKVALFSHMTDRGKQNVNDLIRLHTKYLKYLDPSVGVPKRSKSRSNSALKEEIRRSRLLGLNL